MQFAVCRWASGYGVIHVMIYRLENGVKSEETCAGSAHAELHDAVPRGPTDDRSAQNSHENTGMPGDRGLGKETRSFEGIRKE